MSSTMRPIKLRCRNRLLEEFKRRARRDFPNETYGILLGVECGDNLELAQIYYPEFRCTPNAVWTDQAGYLEAAEHASEHDLTVIGTLHSHPWPYHPDSGSPDHSQSEADYYHAPALKLHGICKVTQSKAGRLRSSIRFWGQLLIVETEIVK